LGLEEGELDMPGGRLKLRFAVPLAAAFLFLDFLFSTVPHFQSDSVSYVFQMVAPLLALAACCWRIRVAASRSRILWALFAAGLAFWSCGTALSAWEDLFQHVPFEVAALSDFAFFFYGVPILFAISTPVEGERSPIFTYLNGVQAAFAGYLTYITIFSAPPLSKVEAHPISISLLVLTYDVENLILALCCLVRLIAAPKGGEERAFYRIMFAFLATYGLGVLIYNHLALMSNGSSSFSFVVDISFLLLALLILRLPLVEDGGISIPARKGLLALFVDNASPVFFTLALLALVMEVLPQHSHTGMAAIGVALGVYGIRTTLLQIRFMRAQQQLQEARDRLEEISLQDGLTGIANRRSFDRALDSEWHRAMRAHHPLSLLLIDLDFFKNLNDTQGHPSGDRCLIEVAGVLRRVASRSGDLVARYGGEEFAVILPATTPEAAASLAEKMQENLQMLKIRNETSIGSYVTVSIGIASYVFPEEGSPKMLVEAADQALYRAKQAGRNRIERLSMQELSGTAISS
jgi:diguanylate cyclase (GGDEF)-like protein